MRSMMPLAILLPLLSACETVAGCRGLPLTSYDRAFELRLADELDAAVLTNNEVKSGKSGKSLLAWPDAVVDYARLRAAVMACQSGKS